MKNLNFSLPNLKLARKRLNKETCRISFKIDEDYKDIGLGKTYYIFTYGCQGNEADSETISGILENLGYKKSDDHKTSDLILLNTCAIRENAENRIFGVLGGLKGLKRVNKDLVIGVCGCMPQEEKVVNRFLEKYKFIDIVFGTHNIYSLPKLLKNTYLTKNNVFEVLSYEGDILEDAPKIRNHSHKAFVNIMYGCDEFCTYCIVPYTRGKERSRLKDDIINEVLDLVSKGYSEITLLGQNVNAYGKDLNIDYTFGNLLFDLDKTNIKRIRFTTSHPKDLDDLTIKALKECRSVMPHLHLPVQSGNDRVLKSMNRKYTYNDYMVKINKLKKEIPDISITTDIIVGFPLETYEEFLDTLKLVEEVKFEGAFTFVYSKREGTPAAKIEDTVSDEDKKQRLFELNKVVNKYYLEGHKRFVGEVCEVLVDGFSKTGDNMMCGYSRHYKLTHFYSNDESLIGKTVKVRITTAKTWFMIGELLDE